MHKEYIAGPGCARKRRARPLLHMGHNISWRSSKTYEHNMKRERQTDRQRKSQRNRKRREGGGGEEGGGNDDDRQGWGNCNHRRSIQRQEAVVAVAGRCCQ